MAYAFCLRFDEANEAAVLAVWHALAAGGASDDMLRLGYPPHLTLATLDDEPPLAVVEAALDGLGDVAEFAVRLGGVKRFPETPIAWLAVDGGPVLADLHRQLSERLPEALVREHYRIGQWVPHVTLQTQGDADMAMRIADAAWPAVVKARVERLELVQFPPVVVLKGLALG
jgi:2'-5' RNA ligase